MIDNDNNKQFSLIADFDGDEKSLLDVKVDGEIPILPLRNMVLFPGVVIPCTIGRKSSLRLVKSANKKDAFVGVVCQRDPKTEEPQRDDLYLIGTLAKVLRIFEMPDNNITVLLQGFARFELLHITNTQPYLKGEVEVLKEILPEKGDKEFSAMVEACRDLTERYLKYNEATGAEPNFAVRNISNKMFFINFVSTNIPFSTKDKYELLYINSVSRRASNLIGVLGREVQYAALKAKIREKSRTELDRQQKEYFLQQQMKNIQEELGEENGNPDLRELQEKLEAAKLPEQAEEYFSREYHKLTRLAPQSPDYSVQYTYLQTFLSLPWDNKTKDCTNIKNAQKVLDGEHFGMSNVKERILEHLAVLNLRKDFKAPIMCLYGPPGVGKTSLGRRIAKALDRTCERVSLGGVHDESEIRGHRRTYVGAMPGRIIKSIIKCKANNPVIILDEIDKVTDNKFHGDPCSALLEVLDPEQNNAFHDNYLDYDYDLSKVLFVATANTLSTIPPALLDRMELIEVSGYLTEEKIEIAQRHLIPKVMENTGVDKSYNVRLSKRAIERIVEQYTRESGVRELEKQLNKIFRKIAFNIVSNSESEYVGKLLQPADIEALLGKPRYMHDKYQGNKYAGVVTGLAWTSVGGEILFIETCLSKGKGSKLTLTGNLGDVMKESAVLALEYLKAHADMLNVDYRIFENWNIHIHVPEGATPKDGPSAGITIATSIASAITQRKVRPNVAMTGEITLRGKVLPVGGIKEKILAAKRAGITDILISRENTKDINEIPEVYVKGVTFHYVDNVQDVLNFALLDEKVDDAVEFTIDSDNNNSQTKETSGE